MDPTSRGGILRTFSKHIEVTVYPSETHITELSGFRDGGLALRQFGFDLRTGDMRLAVA